MGLGGKVGAGTGIDTLLGTSSGGLSGGIKRTIQEYRDALVDAGLYTEDKINAYRKVLIKDNAKHQEKLLKEINKRVAYEQASDLKKIFMDISENFGKALSSSINSTLSGIDSYIKSYTQSMGVLTTRLQGTGLTYNKIVNDVSKNLATSPYLRQADMLTNLNKFVEAGIAYNVESRAYIATATQKIATTFDAFDSSLLRLIRIQQADSTVARLGMESLLTKFLNARYEDTSYLNSSSGITASLLEAESLMGYQGASEFEYAVNRWLGSMSALGVSSSTVNMIAQGLGYLGSGNISALSGNSTLQNLFAMASGGNYGSLLTGGLTAGSASDIINNIVALGQNIAMSGNNVVKSQFASLFGLSVSDLVSLLNITTEDVKEITKGIVDYEQLRNETTNQLSTMWQRSTPTEMVSNVLSNAMSRIGAGLVNDPAMYAMWELANLMSSSGVDTTFEFAPFGVGMSMTLTQLMKTGIVGQEALTSLLPAIVGNAFKGNLGGTRLDVWNEQQTRGRGLSLIGSTSGVTTSSSSYIGTTETSDLQQTFQSATNTTEYTGEQSSENDVQAIRQLLETELQTDIHSILNILQDWNTRSILF